MRGGRKGGRERKREGETEGMREGEESPIAIPFRYQTIVLYSDPVLYTAMFLNTHIF